MWYWSLECYILQASTEMLGGFLSKGNLKTHPHNDAFAPTRSYLLQKANLLLVPLPTTYWGPIAFRLPRKSYKGD